MSARVKSALFAWDYTNVELGQAGVRVYTHTLFCNVRAERVKIIMAGRMCLCCICNLELSVCICTLYSNVKFREQNIQLVAISVCVCVAKKTSWCVYCRRL